MTISFPTWTDKVGTNQGGTAIPRSLLARLQDIVSIKDYGVLGNGTNEQTGITAAITAWKVPVFESGLGYELVIPPGTYAAPTWPSLVQPNRESRIRGLGLPVLYATGAGLAFDLQQLTGSPYGPHFENLEFRGNAASTRLINMTDLHRVTMSNINLRDCNPATQAFLIQFCILSDFDHITCGTHFTVGAVPNIGMQLGTGTISSTSVDVCNFYNLIFEGLTSTGLVLTNCIDSGFFGGTSEANGGGVTVAAVCYGNTFDHFFCEANAGTDFSIQGYNNQFRNCEGTSTTGLVVTGQANYFLGGRYSTINSSGGTHNVFDGVRYITSWTPNAGTDKWRNIYNEGTGAFIADQW